MQARGVEPNIPSHLRIAVTGHRRLPDSEELSARVDEALDVHIPALFDPANRSPIGTEPRTPLAFTVLTALAEGADRYVAETILERPNVEIEVVLPLTADDYIEDFETAASRAEFRRLLALVRQPVALRARPLAADCAPSELAEARKRAYEDLGRYLVQHCDVLLAVWDGEPARGRGGTAEVVQYARSIGRPVVVIRTKKPGGIEVYAAGGIST